MTDLSRRAAHIHKSIRNAGPMTLEEIRDEYKLQERINKGPTFFRQHIIEALQELLSRGMVSFDGMRWEWRPEPAVSPTEPQGKLFT